MFKLNLVFLFSLLALTIQLKAQDTIIIDRVISEIGNKIILNSDVETQYLQFKARGIESKGDPKCEIFEELLFQKLLVNQAEIDSIELSDKEIESELNQKLDIFIQQAQSIENLLKYFNVGSLYEIKDKLRPVLREQILAQKMQRKITEDIKITPSEVNKFFSKIPKDSLPLIDLQLEVQQIVIYPEITNEEKQIVKNKLNEIRNEIISGKKKFATMAILYSEDPMSAKKGGELGFMARAELVPEFSIVAFSLRAGEVSEIIETDFGYHIIEMIDRKGEKINVRHILISPKVSLDSRIKARNKLDSLIGVLKKDTLGFERIAQRFSEDVDTKNNGGLMINPYTGSSKFEIKYLDPTTASRVKSMSVGEITAPFEAMDMKAKSCYKILRLKSRVDAHVANMKDDYQRIQELALQSKKEERINKWISEKQKSTYISIIPEYRHCKFHFDGWQRN